MDKEVTIVSPIKVVQSDVYMLVIEDANGIRHYWTQDGEYDGWQTKGA